MKVKWLVPVAALAVVASACGSSDSSSGDDSGDKTFDVILISGVTGPLASLTKDEVDALNVAADQLNADGGIDGEKVTVTALDSGGDPTKAVSKLQEQLSNSKPDLVFAGIASAETLALLPQLTRQQVLSMATTNNPTIDDASAYPYHFGLASTAEDQLSSLPAELQKAGVKSLSVLLSNDAFGEGELASVKAVLDGSGIQIDEETYNATDVDYSVAYQKALDHHDDAMFIDGTGDSIGRLITARDKLGATDVPTYAGSGLTTVPPTSVASPDQLKNLYCVVLTAMVSGKQTPVPDGTTTLVDKLKLGDQKVVYVPGLAYDGLMAAALAAKQAGSTSVDDLKAALDDLDVAEGYFVTRPAAGGFNWSKDEQFPVTPDGGYSWVTPVGIKDGLWTPAS